MLIRMQKFNQIDYIDEGKGKYRSRLKQKTNISAKKKKVMMADEVEEPPEVIPVSAPPQPVASPSPPVFAQQSSFAPPGISPPVASAGGGSVHGEEEDGNVLVNTPFGQRMMTMREYNQYVKQLEDKYNKDEQMKRAEKEKRRKEREARREAKRKAVEEEKKKQKEYIVPQALFGMGGESEKVFPPHLYPSLYPERFPDLFPHVYGAQLMRDRKRQKAMKVNGEEMLLFRDPRANRVGVERMGQLRRIMWRAVKSLGVYRQCWVNMARVIRARRGMSNRAMERLEGGIEAWVQGWVGGLGGKIKELIEGRVDIDVRGEGGEEKVATAQATLQGMVDELIEGTKGFESPDLIQIMKYLHWTCYFNPFYPQGYLWEWEKRRFEFSKYGFVRNGRGNRFGQFMVSMVAVVRQLIGNVLGKREETLAKMKPKEGEEPVEAEGEADDEKGKNNALVASSVIWEVLRKDLEGLLPLLDGDPDEKIPKRARVSTREPMVIGDGGGEEDGEPKGEDGDEGAEEDGEKKPKKAPPLPIKGLLSGKELEPILSDGLFVLDFKDRLKTWVKMLTGEMRQVARDLRSREIEGVCKIRDRIVRACERKHPRTEGLIDSWVKKARKEYGIAKEDMKKGAEHKVRKYEEKDVEDIIEEDEEGEEESPADGDGEDDKDNDKE